MSSTVRSCIIGGIIFTIALCSASTVTPQRTSSTLTKLLPHVQFFDKKPAVTTTAFHVHVMHSAVLDFAPWLELHHVVFVGESNSRKVYAVDYSPLNQRENIVNLLLGRYVPAEIRVRLLTAGNVHDVADVKRQWSCLNMMSANPQTPSLEDVFSSDGDMIETQKFIRRIVKKWDTSMNLYTHNCQHFSWFVKNQLREEEICML